MLKGKAGSLPLVEACVREYEHYAPGGDPSLYEVMRGVHHWVSPEAKSAVSPPLESVCSVRSVCATQTGVLRS